MSILDSLKGLVGLIPGVGPVATALSSVLGGASKSANESNILNDRTKLGAWNDQEAAGLARDKYATAAPGQRLNTSYRASIMDRFTPTKVVWGGPGSGLKGELPQYTGGFRDAMANPDPSTKGLSQRVMTDMLADQVRGGRTGGAQDSYVSPQPKIGEASGFGNVLGGIGLGSSILGALSKLKFGGKSPTGGYNGPFAEGE